MSNETCPGCSGPRLTDETGRWLSITTGYSESRNDNWHETTIVVPVPRNADAITVLWRRCYGPGLKSSPASLARAVREAL